MPALLVAVQSLRWKEVYLGLLLQDVDWPPPPYWFAPGGGKSIVESDHCGLSQFRGQLEWVYQVVRNTY
jgi:hypothetical protein